jgi:N-acetylmuramidase
MKLTNDQITEIAKSIGVDYAALMAFISVESGGLGFSSDTGKIIIQFEPSWFRKKAPYTPSGKWSLNKVDRQSKEWEAFNDAFKLNPNAAMESTSIGLGQIMGLHYTRLGYKTVGEMWEDFKKGEYQQVLGIAKFISTDSRLLAALKARNWHLVATHYNGSKYKELARKIGREPYNISMQKAYLKYAA